MIMIKIAMMLFKKQLLTFLPIAIKHWKLTIIIVLSAFILYQNTFETRLLFGIETIPALEERLSISKQSLSTCNTSTTTLTTTINKNNDIIREQAQKTKALKERFDQLTIVLNENKRISDKTITELLNQPAPKSCNEAIQYLKEQAQ